MFKTIDQYLNESITPDIVSLKKYLDISDDEKGDELAYLLDYKFEDFCDENGYDYSEYEGEWGPDMGEIESANPELFKQFGQHLLQNIERGILDYDQSELPSWVHMGSPRYIQNQWLVHFTDDAESVAKEGFIYGVSDLTKLGLTTQLSQSEKDMGGFNFAYRINDFERYGSNRHGWKYGSEAVVFLASGVIVDHYGDEEPQVIFDGKTAKNIIPIAVESGEYIIYSLKTGQPLVRLERLQDIVHWITKNYDQYRKHII